MGIFEIQDTFFVKSIVFITKKTVEFMTITQINKGKLLVETVKFDNTNYYDFISV